MSDQAAGEQSEKPDEGDGDKASNRGCLIGCLGVFALVAVVFTSCTLQMADGPDEFVPDGIGARMACEDFVEERLKAPSTAEFTDGTTTGTAAEGWTVTGSVDSENSFGAMIRNDWSCEVRYDEAAETWRGNVEIG